MLQALDLTAIAKRIDAPYQPVPLVTLGAVQASVLICEGPKAWHRAAPSDELMLVIEGVITIEAADGTLVVNEGELARVPRKTGLTFNSGMRSTVALLQESRQQESGNGYHPIAPRPVVLDKVNVAIDVLSARTYHWQRAGVTGGYAAFATRMVGRSEPYVTPSGSLLALVYRGVMDYESDADSGSVVGGQALVVPGRTRLGVRSERGATVLVVARKGAPLPAPLGGSEA